MRIIREELHTNSDKRSVRQKRTKVPPNQTPFGDSIKVIRKREGAKRGLHNSRGKPRSLSQPELAEELNVSLDSVKNWEQHYNVPEMETLLKICKMYQCDLDWLFGRIKEPTHEIKYVSEVTGLAPDVVEKMTTCDVSIINSLVQSDLFVSVTDSFKEYQQYITDYTYSQQDLRFCISTAQNTEDSSQLIREADTNHKVNMLYVDGCRKTLGLKLDKVIADMIPKD